MNVIATLDYSHNLFMVALDSYTSTGTLLTGVLIGIHLVMLIILMSLIIIYYIRRLNSEFNKLKTVVGMIPISALTTNPEVKKVFLETNFFV